jgi:hypothetical protein
LENELDHIRKRLRVEGEKTIAFFDALSPTDWDQKIYTSGSGWRVREVLAHFISAERAYQRYLQDVLQGGVGAPDDLDIDQFNETDVATMEGLSPEQLLVTYQLVRDETIRITELIEEDDLVKRAKHPWFESKEIGWFLKLLYRHNTMHRQDMLKSLKTGKPLPPFDTHRTGSKIDQQS